LLYPLVSLVGVCVVLMLSTELALILWVIDFYLYVHALIFFGIAKSMYFGCK